MNDKEKSAIADEMYADAVERRAEIAVQAKCVMLMLTVASNANHFQVADGAAEALIILAQNAMVNNDPNTIIETMTAAYEIGRLDTTRDDPHEAELPADLAAEINKIIDEAG